MVERRALRHDPSAGRRRAGPRLFQCAAEHCKLLSPNVRVDTHANNTTMQRLIEKSGFKKCGIIHVRDGSPRIAYHWTAR